MIQFLIILRSLLYMYFAKCSTPKNYICYWHCKKLLKLQKMIDTSKKVTHFPNFHKPCDTRKKNWIIYGIWYTTVTTRLYGGPLVPSANYWSSGIWCNTSKVFTYVESSLLCSIDRLFMQPNSQHHIKNLIIYNLFL